MNYLNEDDIDKEMALALLLEQDKFAYILDFSCENLTKFDPEQDNIICNICNRYGSNFWGSRYYLKQMYHFYVTINSYPIVIDLIIKNIERKLTIFYNKQIRYNQSINSSEKKEI